MFNRGKILAALVLLFIWVVVPVNAQSEARAILSNIDLTGFPTVAATLDLRNADGYFMSGLAADVAAAIEDNQSLPATISEVRPGAQLVVAYSGGGSFGILNLEARTRYDLLGNWLLTWASTQAETGVDDLSLIMPEGVLIRHQMDPAAWSQGWQGYQPNFNNAATPLEVLTAAVDTALDPSPTTSMGRVVLFITSAMPDTQQPVLQSLVDRAAQGGVRIHIIYVESTALFTSNDAVILQAAARQTNGQYFPFSSEEPLPDLNLLLESSRRVYRVEYRSIANTPGTHTLQVKVATSSGEMLSQVLNYDAQISPPIPVFVAPPLQIVRTVPRGISNKPENLAPNIYSFEVLMEFPDNIQREIKNSALYVNDIKMIENTVPPVEQFTLDISPYQTSQTILLRVEVTDELGLTGSSLDLPVEILIQSQHTNIFTSLGRNITILIFGIVGLAGAVLLLVLVLGGRIAPRRLGERKPKRTRVDPVTQPVRSVKGEDSKTLSPFQKIMNRLPATQPIWPSRTRPVTDPFGYLEQINEDGEPLSGAVTTITSVDLTFGSDPRQAVVTLDDPSVEPLHARLWRDLEGGFAIEDNHTVAGTWVNYAPVASNGTHLNHGDLIHIARIGFRFTLNKPALTRTPVISPLADQPDEKGEEP